MEITFNFDMNDPQDRVDAEKAFKADDMALALWEIQSVAHSLYNDKVYAEGKLLEEEEKFEYLRNKINEILEDRGVDVDKLAT